MDQFDKLSRCNREHSKGLSLIELMISLTIAIFLISGMVVFIQNNTASHIAATHYTALQDSGRSALGIILESFKRAGYMGIYSLKTNDLITVGGGTAVSATCGVSGAAENWVKMMEQPVFALNQDKVNSSSYTCIKSAPGYDVNHNSDILVLRHAGGEQVATMQKGANYIQSSLSRAFVFNYNGSNVPSYVQFDGETPIATNRLVATAYYVGDSSEQCNGKAIPSLFRYRMDDSGKPVHEELILGIERLQVRYLVETSSGDQYLDPDEVSSGNLWNQTKSARIWVLARTPCEDTTATDNETYQLGDITYKPADNHRRRLYTSTTAFRNTL